MGATDPRLQKDPRVERMMDNAAKDASHLVKESESIKQSFHVLAFAARISALAVAMIETEMNEWDIKNPDYVRNALIGGSNGAMNEATIPELLQFSESNLASYLKTLAANLVEKPDDANAQPHPTT